MEEDGCSVACTPIDGNSGYAHGPDDVIVIAVPVAVQSTFPFILDFLERFPAGGNDVYFMDTMAVYSGGLIGPMGALFRKKGYHTAGAAEFMMPSNFFKTSRDAGEEQRVRETGLSRMAGFYSEMKSGGLKWKRSSPLSALMSRFARSEMLWNKMRKKYTLRADRRRCINCGLCVRICPVGNIRMGEDIHFGDHCQYCMRCFTYCPTDAISVNGHVFKKYAAAAIDDVLNP